MTPGEWKAADEKLASFEKFQEATARNKRVQARYDELMAEGRHGHQPRDPPAKARRENSQVGTRRPNKETARRNQSADDTDAQLTL